MFDHEGPTMINAIRNLTVEVYKHLEISSKLDLDLRIKYTERILKVPVLKEFPQFMLECKELDKGLAGCQWSLGLEKSVTMEQFWTCANVERRDGTGYPISGAERYTYFEEDLW